MKLKPLRDRVIVKPSESEEVTKSGIVLPESAKEEPQEGEVVAVGPGAVEGQGQGPQHGGSTGQRLESRRR